MATFLYFSKISSAIDQSSGRPVGIHNFLKYHSSCIIIFNLNTRLSSRGCKLLISNVLYIISFFIFEIQRRHKYWTTIFIVLPTVDMCNVLAITGIPSYMHCFAGIVHLISLIHYFLHSFSAMTDNFDDHDPDDDLFNNYYLSVRGICSNYYSLRNFNDTFTELDGDFTLCNYNIRSFLANYGNFEGFLEALDNKFNVIILTETRFAAGCGREMIGYTGHHVGRVGGSGGGVSIYCDALLHADTIAHCSYVSENIESCVIKISINQRNLTIIAIYRPPSGLVGDFVNSLLEILNDPLVSNSEIILAGDLNINLIDYERSGDDVGNFVHSMYSLNFLPVITRPTRFPLGSSVGHLPFWTIFGITKVIA